MNLNLGNKIITQNNLLYLSYLFIFQIFKYLLYLINKDE